VDGGITDDEQDRKGAVGIRDEAGFVHSVTRRVHVRGVLGRNLSGGREREYGGEKKKEFGHKTSDVRNFIQRWVNRMVTEVFLHAGGAREIAIIGDY